jgi:hypothetical protein
VELDASEVEVGGELLAPTGNADDGIDATAQGFAPALVVGGTDKLDFRNATNYTFRNCAGKVPLLL